MCATSYRQHRTLQRLLGGLTVSVIGIARKITKHSRKMNQIQKLLILGLFLAVSLDACLGRQKLNAKAMQEFADAVVQGT